MENLPPRQETTNKFHHKQTTNNTKIDPPVRCYTGANKVDVEATSWKTGAVLSDESTDKITLVNTWSKVFSVSFVLTIEHEPVCYTVESVGKNKSPIIHTGTGRHNMTIFVAT